MVNIVLMGVSGSGKTKVGGELVQQLDFTFKDGDDFHRYWIVMGTRVT